MRPEFILMDIEGTTTSVAFVFETLFPFFVKHFREVLPKHGDQDEIKRQIQSVKSTVLEEEGKTISDEEAMQQLEDWVRNDRKHTALKALQGIVWRTGYENGELKSHIYEDVPPTLETWKTNSIHMGIYSSGSIAAQKLLYANTDFGDLTTYLSHHFDTTSGHKREEHSYRNIAEQIGLNPGKILFLSDAIAELDAARSAGMDTIHVVRPGTEIGQDHPVARDFYQVDALLDYLA